MLTQWKMASGLVMAAALGGCAAGVARDGGEGGAGDELPSCLTVTCDEHATCADADAGPVCTCNEGFTGDGETCTDIDECTNGSATCDSHAACENTPGAYTCTCKTGYFGDGKTCIELDECQQAASCDPNANCQNTNGSYTCTCKPGFSGDGKTCTDIDECQLGMTACDPHATCTNIPGGYACKCDPGYVGNGKTCTHADECVDGGGCDPNATCENTPDAHTCTCNEGYTGDGVTCDDIDECQLGMTDCDVNADCQNTPGAYSCACKSGYVGNGLTCTPVGMGAPGEVAIEAGAGLTASTAVTLYLLPPGNHLDNPGAEAGDLSEWQILADGGSGWASTTSAYLFGQSAFITSYSLCKRSQVLDLTMLGFSQADLDAAPPITVGEWFQGFGPNYGDSYYFKVELRAADDTVLASFNPGGTMSTASNAWQSVAQTFTGYGPGLRYVYVEDGGHDTEFWLGQYGAVMDGASVVVGDVQVRFSNDNMNWSAWQAFTPTATWMLEPGSGTKTVYVEFADAKGTVWPPVSDTIMLQ
ncbi:EGF domain-containing protein [Polyangium sp. 15x6]|uniref:EGF domain-containing protein n=1 Tax=Polyangium sp. 15x6 TaxID=3042687 RepID=UPI00249C5CB2|nr:EGF domain-containing protein [Polyangium sp. 15x6]MDI3282145.1 EGF domain-containing protein [Polyangium sp. 15x6]